MISRRLIPVFLICAAWGALAQGRPAAGPGAAKGARSDAEIEGAIRDRFARSKSAADHFTVRVHGGVATIEGRTDVVQRKGSATRMAKSAGARKVIPLAVAGAFHSPLMEPARAAFAAVLDQATFADASLPVAQNADPTLETQAFVIRTRLAAQITSPVRWTETMVALRTAGAGTLVEAGPGSVLKGLARRVDGLAGASVEDGGVDVVLEGLEA